MTDTVFAATDNKITDFCRCEHQPQPAHTPQQRFPSRSDVCKLTASAPVVLPRLCTYTDSHLIKLGFGREVKFRGANGGVYMRFKRALEPMQAYTVVTRVLGWDEKWLFVEHLFEGRDGRVKACGLCKLVLCATARSCSHPTHT